MFGKRCGRTCKRHNCDRVSLHLFVPLRIQTAGRDPSEGGRREQPGCFQSCESNTIKSTQILNMRTCSCLTTSIFPAFNLNVDWIVV